MLTQYFFKIANTPFLAIKPGVSIFFLCCLVGVEDESEVAVGTVDDDLFTKDGVLSLPLNLVYHHHRSRSNNWASS